MPAWTQYVEILGFRRPVNKVWLDQVYKNHKKIRHLLFDVREDRENLDIKD